MSNSILRVKSSLKVTFLAFALVFTASLSGCSNSNEAADAQSKPTSVFFDSSQMSTELKKEIDSFEEPLPTNVKWFTKTPSQLSQDKTTYEDGVAAGAVAFYWLCAWEESYLNAFDSGDSVQQDSSIKMIGKWDALPFYKAHYSDPDQAWRRTVLDPATLGDPTALRETFNNDCRELVIQHK